MSLRFNSPMIWRFILHSTNRLIIMFGIFCSLRESERKHGSEFALPVLS